MAIILPNLPTLLSIKLRSIIDHSEADCSSFDSKLYNEADKVNKEGNVEHANALSFLAAICSFHFRPDDRTAPFGPMIVLAESRSPQGSDLMQDHITLLLDYISYCDVKAIHTRICDLIWTNDRTKHDQARLAIDGYVSLANGLLDGIFRERFESERAIPFFARDLLIRAGVITRATGWERQQNEALRSTSTRFFRAAVTAKDPISIINFGNLAIAWRTLPPEEALDLTHSLVAELVASQALQSAADLQSARANWAKRIGQERYKAEAVRLSNLYEVMAGLSADGFLAGHLLEQAISALQNLRGVRELRTSLHSKLRDAQVNVIEEMGEISHTTDITGLINHYLAKVDGKNILDILMTLAMFASPTSREAILSQARKTVQNHPLSSLFSSRSIDNRGRTVSVEAGAAVTGDDGLTRTILQAQDIHMGLTVAGALDPVRRLLMERGPVHFELIIALCMNSPFVPIEAQHIFAKGIYAFLTGDDAVGIAILAPLLEGGLRRLLELSGEIVTSIDTNGIEQTLNLSALLGQKRDILDKILGSGLTFSIEMLFDHQSGPKIRHRICHAIYADGDFHSKDSAYGCLLIFSIMMLAMRGNWPGIKAHLEGILPTGWLQPIHVEMYDAVDLAADS